MEDCGRTFSAGLTIVADVAIATGPPLLGPLPSVVLNLFSIMQELILELSVRNKLSERWPIFHTSYTETLFAESKLNFVFCLGFCFCVKVNFTL